MLSLEPWNMNIQELLYGFLHVDIQHTYREYNEEVDLLSKQALLLEEGKIFLNVFGGKELVSEHILNVFIFYWVGFCISKGG